MITKFFEYVISGKLLDLISIFLRNRKQRVVMGAIESDWRDILSGVTQESVFGPLLFVIHKSFTR